MALTVQTVKEQLEEFASTPSAEVQQWMDVASRRLNLVTWGNMADDAHMWLTGHYLKSAKKKGALGGGALTSKKVGPFTATYKVSDFIAKSSLSSTSYGREYLDLTRLIRPARVF